MIHPPLSLTKETLEKTHYDKTQKITRIRPFRLTDRDIEILAFINEFGFCEMPQLNQRFGFKKPRNYQIIKRLIAHHFLIHESIFHGRHGTYRLSALGARCTALPALPRVPLATYHHDLTVTNVYLQLRKAYPEATWISTRRLMQNRHENGVGKPGHLPDGVLILENHERVAIEVELTHKGKDRLARILKGYTANFDYQEVRYYCSASTASRIARMTAHMPFIKVHSLGELLM